MSRRPLTRAVSVAVLLAAAIATTGTAAEAADLSYEPHQPKYGSPYDDPRYADIYRHPPPRHTPYRETYRDRGEEEYDDDPRHGEHDDGEYDDTPPRRYVEREFLPPMRGAPRFAETDRYRDDRCVPRHTVKHRLRSEGWSDFHDLELGGDVAYVRARRPSGRLFELKVHRCSGEVVSARPYGPHAHQSRRYWHRS